MKQFAIIRRVLRLCKIGVSVGSAYTQVAHDAGLSRATVVDAFLAAHLARIQRKYPA